MANKSDFSAYEWKLIKDSPYWVQTAITAAEGRMGMLEKRREAKALNEYLSSYKSGDVLVRAVLQSQDGKHDVDPKARLEDVGNTLDQIANIVESKTSRKEFDAFNDFLTGVGNVVAGATSENLLKKDDKISDEEAEALDLIAAALRATEADKAKRAQAEAAAKREAIRKQQDAAKAAQEAKQKAELEKQLAEMKAAAEAAEAEAKRREELAKKQAVLQAERRARMAETRKKAAAAKTAAAEKAAAEAAAAEAAKRVYVVQPGDSLSAISLEVYGSANKWRQIYEANKDKIKNPSLIYPGQEFTIPELD